MVRTVHIHVHDRRSKIHDAPRLPSTFLHQTEGTNKKSILSKGLVAAPDYVLHPDMTKGVNLVVSPDDVPWPAGKGDVHVVVNPAGLDRTKFVYMGSGWWRYNGNIPRGNIVSIRKAT